MCLAVGGDGTFIKAANEFDGPILPVRSFSSFLSITELVRGFSIDRKVRHSTLLSSIIGPPAVLLYAVEPIALGTKNPSPLHL